MRWYKLVIYIGIFLLVVYSLSMYFFVDESKNFTIEKEINFPIEKVFPQFNNFQNFTQWNDFFVSKEEYTFSYYTPYQGMGSSMNYQSTKNKSDFGDAFIKYENPLNSLKYQLYERKESNPYRIDVKFVPKGNKTKIIWYIHTPKQPLLKRSLNLISEDYIADNIDKSMHNLSLLLGGKVDREVQLSKIKFDTLMVEKHEGDLLLGINVSTSNKKGQIIKNIEINHNKVINFVTKDLGKKEDEFGSPVLLTEPSSFKNKEVSYFYGVPLKKRVGVSDNNFNFRTVNPSESYVMYYKGNYANRIRVIGLLLQKAKKDSLRNGELQETFVEAPDAKKEVTLKISLPVFR